MEYRKLGNTGLNVSSIGLGCVTFGREIDKKTAFRVLDHAFARGVTLFDTAAMYADGASEIILGDWIARNRLTHHEPAHVGKAGELVVATKAYPPLTRKNLREAVETSLRSLQVPFIDLYQLHAWDDETPLSETLGALEDLRYEGKIRFIGCSNFTPLQFCRSLRWQEAHGASKFSTIQPIYNLVHREIEDELIPLCREKHIAILTYSPLGAGFLTGKYTPDGTFPKGARFDIKPSHTRHYYNDHGWRTVEHLRQSSEKLGVSMVNLALSWVIKQPGTTSTLIGARKIEHVDQAFVSDALEADFIPLSG
jgi:1-deoxyxylulose-5-phosphate synthase